MAGRINHVTKWYNSLSVDAALAPTLGIVHFPGLSKVQKEIVNATIPDAEVEDGPGATQRLVLPLVDSIPPSEWQLSHVARAMTCLLKFLARGYVHGDVRRANFCLSKTDSPDLLVDFDTCGVLGEAKYHPGTALDHVPRPRRLYEKEDVLRDGKLLIKLEDELEHLGHDHK